MKKVPTLFLKAVILLISISVAVWLIWFPQLEGRAATLDLITVYTDPLILYGYVASIPFFISLYQAFTILGYIDKNTFFSQASVKAVRNIKYCATVLSFLIVLAVVYIRLTVVDDDPAGITTLGMLTTFASIVIATVAAVFQKLIQNAIDIQSENYLTV